MRLDREICNQGVGGSSPSAGTNNINGLELFVPTSYFHGVSLGVNQVVSEGAEDPDRQRRAWADEEEAIAKAVEALRLAMDAKRRRIHICGFNPDDAVIMIGRQRQCEQIIRKALHIGPLTRLGL